MAQNSNITQLDAAQVIQRSYDVANDATRVILVDGSVTENVAVTSSALPTGAATSAKQDTGNTSLASLDTKTPALGQAAMAASRPVVIASNQSTLPVTPAATESHLGQVGGTTTIVSASFTRPADTDAYVVSDVVCDSTSSPQVITFTNVARVNGGSGYISAVHLDKNTAVVTDASFRLYLFKTAPTPINDNSPYTLLYADKDARLGFVDFVLVTEGSGSDCASDSLFATSIPFTAGVASRNLYGILTAQDTYTPGSEEQFSIKLDVELN